MLVLLNEQLAEYKSKYERLKEICIMRMTQGLSWEKYAQEASGYKIMIEATEAEIKRRLPDENHDG